MNTTAYLDGQLELDLVQGLPPGSHVVGLGQPFWAEGLACAVDATGNYFICGTAAFAGPLSIPFQLPQFSFVPYVVKLLSDGKTPDSTFNKGLPVFLATGNGFAAGQDCEATDIYVDPGTGLLTVGWIQGNTNTGAYQGCMSRINSDGTMQSTFGTNGTVVYNHVGASQFAAVRVAVQKVGGNAGKPLLLVPQLGPANFRAELARYTLTGALDTTFAAGLGFFAETFLVGAVSMPRCLVLDATDQIYLGINTTNGGGQTAGWLISRFTAAGAPAGTGWGAAGSNACGVRQTFTLTTVSDICELIIDAAGKLIAVGQSPYNATPNLQIQLARYLTTTGALDTGFNTTGLAAFDYHTIYQPNSGPSRAMLVTGGDLVIAGVTAGAVATQGFSDGGRNLLARYTMASPAVDVWHTILPFLGTSSEVDYGLGGQGWPAGPASSICAVGHDMNDVAVPRYAQAVASYYLLSGALDTTKGT